VIVNLQRTPRDSEALKINAPTDRVMELLMERLGMQIPAFRLERRILICKEDDSVVARTVDVHDPKEETSILCGVDWEGEPRPVPKDERARVIWKNKVYRHPCCNVDMKCLRPTLHFVGHYGEPPITLEVDLTRGGKDIRISFDPLAEHEWSIDTVTCMDEGIQSRVDRDPEYGRNHREFIVAKHREKHPTQTASDAEKEVEKEFLKARLYAEAWKDAVPLEEYEATADAVSVFESCESGRVLSRRLNKGDIVAALGAVCRVGNFEMLPIYPCGAVQFGFVRKVTEQTRSEA